MMESRWLETKCLDGVKRLCHIKEKQKNGHWINTSHILLGALPNYQDNTADAILKYSDDEL